MPRDMCCSGVNLIFHKDGEAEKSLALYWCGMNGDNAEWWDITVTPKEAGIYFYRFTYTTPFGTGNIYLKNSGMGEFAPTGKEWQQTVYDPAFDTPEAVRGGIMYQIFPDRFYDSGKEKHGVPADRVLHTDKNDIPVWQPDGNGKILNNDYYGGDLAGIIEKLPYIASLEVTMIYLNPIFEAHSNHRYNTADYMKIDPLLGNEDDLRELCFKAEKYGITVILDGVFSHTGSDSIYFNREKRYGSGGAYNDPLSPYRPWFTFKPDGTYASWWGIDTLPETDEENPSFIDFITGKNGVLEKWFGCGIGGIRLDVADELPDKFIDALYKKVKSFGSDKLIIGEVWEDASNKISHGGRRRYLLGGQLDSVMNYPFADAVLEFLRYGNAERFADTVVTVCENYPKPALDCLMNHIGTHDTARILSRLVSFETENASRAEQAAHKLTAEEYSRAKQLLKSAAVLQYTLPGFPSLYYGDEAGMTGGSDPFNRTYFPWGGADGELTAFYTKLGGIRRALGCLAGGAFRIYSAMLSCVSYIREDENEKVFIAVNKNPHEIDFYLPDDFCNKTELLTDTTVGDFVKIPAFAAAIIK